MPPVVRDNHHTLLSVHEINLKAYDANNRRRRRFWHATHDCVAPYVHRG